MSMSPTILKYKGFRFYFFSREESRPHVHVATADGEAKFWLEPRVVLAKNEGLTPRQLSDIQTFLDDHKSAIINSWNAYFGR